MQIHAMFEFRLLHCCIIEAGFLSLSLVRGYPPADLGHGMQLAVCCCIFLSRNVWCIYGKSGVYVHLHSRVNVYAAIEE